MLSQWPSENFFRKQQLALDRAARLYRMHAHRSNRNDSLGGMRQADSEAYAWLGAKAACREMNLV
ncbi:MAG: hypothetical protein EBU59_00925 [Planctomycetia bacterium]|nr:hypothetical protein [Planctomycetia bacterium]